MRDRTGARRGKSGGSRTRGCALGSRRRLGAVAAGLAIVAVAAVAIVLGSRALGRPGPASPASAPPASAASDSSAPSRAPLEFTPVSLAGTGDRRIGFDIPEGAAALAKVMNRGAGPFRVQALGAGDAPGEILVDTAGDYSGLVLFDALADQHSVAFDVHSGGDWTIQVEPVGLAPSWSADVPLSGSGDDVALLDAPSDGTSSVRVEHTGSGPITVLAYTDSGDLDQLVAATGDVDELHQVPAGTVCFAVRATGRWALSPG